MANDGEVYRCNICGMVIAVIEIDDMRNRPGGRPNCCGVHMENTGDIIFEHTMKDDYPEMSSDDSGESDEPGFCNN